MKHQRQGWRRLVALPVAMIGALVIAPALVSASPSSTGNTVLAVDTTTCVASVSISWVAQPGRLKTYMTELWSDSNPTPVVIASGALARSGTFVVPTWSLTPFVDSNTFHAVTHVYDGKGVEQDTWPSGDMAAPCI